jgi:hypothetical protein
MAAGEFCKGLRSGDAEELESAMARGQAGDRVLQQGANDDVCKASSGEDALMKLSQGTISRALGWPAPGKILFRSGSSTFSASSTLPIALNLLFHIIRDHRLP